ncbi:hypothetical protein B0A48_16704 [Cryoendolithus antarcticus]|uniref:DUF1857-domain-containing protein n=1 Tax=Cryoendolithus antarcticus TaxID=1507870 RepID=A0A1V8SF00_9PEZI|nr:hypothetical protein B0A48_16704 [Cryoendolithus antarcticus]
MPITVHCAYTEPINPSSATPILTQTQIWNGLQRKIRKAQDFVPIITATDIVSDEGDEVVRIAHFSDRGDGKKEVKEVDFHQPDGSLIVNTVSEGSSLDGKDLNMTYTFEWRYPDVEKDSDRHKELVEMHRKGAKQAVHSSIEALRRMASAGELD